MAIRRPSIASPEWLFQDFLYQEAAGLGGSELRYIQVKWDGEVYERVSQSFDYSDPPYVGPEQRGGSIVGQIDYEVSLSTKLVTIYSWNVNWRDEWPLRLLVNYLTQCLYPVERGFVIRVAAEEVYNQAGEAMTVASRDPYAFWVSERFTPLTNLPNDYLVYAPVAGASAASSLPVEYFVSISPNPAGPGAILYVQVNTNNVPLTTPLYWRLSGPGINPSFFTDGRMSGVISVGT